MMIRIARGHFAAFAGLLDRLMLGGILFRAVTAGLADFLNSLGRFRETAAQNAGPKYSHRRRGHNGGSKCFPYISEGSVHRHLS